MEIVHNKWVKPFSTGMSCIDTIDGECVRGVDIKACTDLCEKSDLCFCGYHVKLPNDKVSYCLPLNGLPIMDNPDIFRDSIINPDESPIISPETGVDVTVFYNRDTIDQAKKLNNVDDVSQLGIYFLRFHSPHDNTVFYLRDDFTFGTGRDDAMQITLFRDLPTFSAISTRDNRLRNGEAVFVQNNRNNHIFLFVDIENFSFSPLALRVSSSIDQDITRLYHTQIITEYPFSNKVLRLDDKFAIRLSTIPITDRDDIYYWDIDTKNMKSVFRRYTMKDLTINFRQHLDKHKHFSLEKHDDNLVSQTTNFVSSQGNYLLRNYVTGVDPEATRKQKSTTEHFSMPIVCPYSSVITKTIIVLSCTIMAAILVRRIWSFFSKKRTRHRKYLIK